MSAQPQWEALHDLGDLIRATSNNRDDFIRECKEGRLDEVVAAYRTAESIETTGLFDQELINVVPKSWVFLASCGEYCLRLKKQ